ncbi:MAG TPA: septum formation inhibitor Maf [Achromobacter sp.]|uniref:Maf family protein n=1 Tax=Achromobacter sp. TaxID=134375 RepID=UPI000E97A55E|nr:Maf family protein [Achromobacter sp.]MDX3987514.1 Maf family protein [Achromobacter sp.]HBL65718.1 septum formation inhibitor Maf [Achromobacter sp.]HCQ50270.1 septum formation inhibitor Maf [Achromobacter sp.]
MSHTADTDASPARLYLASASPRRRELLTQIGLAHKVLLVPAPPGEDEPQHEGESAADYVQRTARDKALRGRDWMHDHALPDLPLLAADTTVILNGAVLGKPADREDAFRILRALSGSVHEVHTAVAVCAGGQLLEAVSITQVQMRELGDDEIGRYCDSGEPYGKAGAYGIQGLAGAFISHISGSYTGVMGLPLFETANLLRTAGIHVP